MFKKSIINSIRNILASWIKISTKNCKSKNKTQIWTVETKRDYRTKILIFSMNLSVKKGIKFLKFLLFVKKSVNLRHVYDLS